MICPKCNNTMNKINSTAFDASKCIGCAGIWFKDAAREVAEKFDRVTNIDNDNTNAGVVYNEVRNVNCPECDIKLMKMRDIAQLHIQYESCTDCHGMFFDAGEFNDLAEFTLLERIKQTIDTVNTNIKN